MKLIKTSFPILMLLFLITSCKEEPKDAFKPELIIGKWELSKAFTNNKITERLDGAYLEFMADGTMKTNILGTEETGKYQIKEKMLIQETSRLINYSIQKLDTETLHLHMTLAQNKFKLNLKKAKVS